MRVKHNTDDEFGTSLGLNYVTQMSPECMLNIIQTTSCWHLPCSQLCYPNVARMRVKRNASDEFGSSLGLHHVTQMSPECVENAMQTMSLAPPLVSAMLPRCRQNACKT